MALFFSCCFFIMSFISLVLLYIKMLLKLISALFALPESILLLPSCLSTALRAYFLLYRQQNGLCIAIQCFSDSFGVVDKERQIGVVVPLKSLHNVEIANQLCGSRKVLV